MKFISAVIVTAVLAYLLGIWLPWWAIAIAAFITAIAVKQSAGRAFFCGFAGIFLAWGILAWAANSANGGVLAARVATILPLRGSAFMLIFVTALVGALVGGMSAMTGSLLGKKGKHGRTA